MLTNSQKKAIIKKQGVGTFAYYSTEALDCPSCIISKAHA